MNVVKAICLGLLLLLYNFGINESTPAQETKLTTISGVVLDPNNARVVDASVKIENAEIRKHARSDDEGRFRIELPPGDYRIIAEHQGFKRFEFSHFHANSGDCELVNIHLEVEPPRSTQKVN